MSKQANKTLIGAFVIGAIVLVVAGLIIFGSGKFFKKNLDFVMYFEGSVKGLQVGSPVVFRGVKVGEVTDIGLRFNTDTLTVVIPVYAEVDPEKFSAEGKREIKPYSNVKALIDKGLRARLESQSFVTGQLMIGLDFYPNQPIRLVGLDKKYHEIPTIPTTMQELQKKIEDLPLKEITTKLNNVLEGVDKLVNSPDTQASVRSLNQAIQSMDKLAQNMNAQMGPLAADLRKTSEAARGTFVQAEKTLAMEQGAPGQIATSVIDTMKAARLTLEETQKAVVQMNQIADQNANVGYQINKSLEQIAAMSRSMRVLSDYLERHPEALIKGK